MWHDVVHEGIWWHDIPVLERVDRELLERDDVLAARTRFCSCNERKSSKTKREEEWRGNRNWWPWKKCFVKQCEGEEDAVNRNESNSVVTTQIWTLIGHCIVRPVRSWCRTARSACPGSELSSPPGTPAGPPWSDARSHPTPDHRLLQTACRGGQTKQCWLLMPWIAIEWFMWGLFSKRQNL